jgi:hypothetical protein
MNSVRINYATITSDGEKGVLVTPTQFYSWLERNFSDVYSGFSFYRNSARPLKIMLTECYVHCIKYRVQVNSLGIGTLLEGDFLGITREGAALRNVLQDYLHEVIF